MSGVVGVVVIEEDSETWVGGWDWGLHCGIMRLDRVVIGIVMKVICNLLISVWCHD